MTQDESPGFSIPLRREEHLHFCLSSGIQHGKVMAFSEHLGIHTALCSRSPHILLYTHENGSTSAGSLSTTQLEQSHPGRWSLASGELFPLLEVKREADNPYSLESAWLLLERQHWVIIGKQLTPEAAFVGACYLLNCKMEALLSLYI